MSDTEAKTLKMYSDEHAKDMWYVDNGNNHGICYLGPFETKAEAESCLNQLNIE